MNRRTLILLSVTATLVFSSAASPAATQVPLTIRESADFDRADEPVTFGVPFPENTLTLDMPVVVTANGTAVPTQTTPLATWTKLGTYVRWLLIDCQVDAATASGTQYALRFGDDAPSAPDKSDLRMQRTGARVTIVNQLVEAASNANVLFEAERVAQHAHVLVAARHGVLWGGGGSARPPARVDGWRRSR